MRLAIFPLRLKIRNIRNFPISLENLVSFDSVNVTIPLRSLLQKKKNIDIEIVKPIFILNDSLLKNLSKQQPFTSSFNVLHIDIEDGQLVYSSDEIDVVMKNFMLKSSKKTAKTAFQLQSPHLSVRLLINGKKIPLEGNLNSEFRDLGDSIRITHWIWQTRDILFHANGKIFKDGSMAVNTVIKGAPEEILEPLMGDFIVRGSVFGNARVYRSKKGKLWVQGDFSSPSLQVKGEMFQTFSGSVSWDNQTLHLNLNSRFLSGGRPSSCTIDSVHGEVGIVIQNASAASFAKIVDIADVAPLEGTVRKTDIRINEKSIRGTALIDRGDEPSAPESPFRITGEVAFQKVNQSKEFRFSAEKVVFNDGQFSITGKTNSAQKTADIRIDAVLTRLEHIHPLADFYLGLNLKAWRLEKGTGNFGLTLVRRGGRRQIKSRLTLDHFLSRGQDISSLSGEIENSGTITNGEFLIQSDDLQGKASARIDPLGTSITFRDIKGESQKIIRLLDLTTPLKGMATGDFTYGKNARSKEESVTGRFKADRLFFIDNPLDNVQADIRSNMFNVELNNLNFQYKSGVGRAEVLIDYEKKSFAVSGSIKNVNISEISSDFKGKGDLEIKGQGTFFKDPLQLHLRLYNLYYYNDRPFEVKGDAQILTDFSDYSIASRGEVANAVSQSPFAIEIQQKNSRYTGSFSLNLKDLNLLIPWKNNDGEMKLLGQIVSDAKGEAGAQGVATFSGETLAFPNFSHSLNNFQGFITFNNGQFVLQSLTAEMGSGKIQGNGHVILKNSRIQDLNFNLIGKEMVLYPMDKTHCKLNADLTLKYLNGQLLLQGTMNFLSAVWEREIAEGVSFYTRSELSPAESKMLNLLQFDIKLIGEDDIQMNNSLGKINGRFNLQLSGTNEFPILTGAIESRNGEIFFSGRTFNVIKAKLVFANKFFIDPMVNLEAEAFIQNYRIRFAITGTANHPKPEFVSSPPLPPQDILALISLGEMYKRSGSTEYSSQMGSTAMISSKLTENIKNRANKILGIDLLRIDPLLTGQSSISTSRLTVGKSIGKDLIIVYSTNLGTSKQEILYFQYQLSPAFSLIGMKNEEGKYSIDFRFKKRR